MLPYLHIGPLTLPTYGLLAATGLAVAYLILRADLRRHAVNAEPEMIIGLAGIAGVVGAKLYHLLVESPRAFFADPWSLLFSRTGLAWSGGLVAGFLALVLLARRYKMRVLQMFDLCSPAAAIGYGVGRLGCLTSGDGDYGIPTSLPWGMSFPNGLVPTTERVHPTPIYEFLGSVVIFWILWKLGKPSEPQRKRGNKEAQGTERPEGFVFAWYLILTGFARFLVEFIRINPRVIFGLTDAQIVSLVCIIAGVALRFVLRHSAEEYGY